ncbi:hypothetical protein [Coleofasciculus sp. FACHB-1120]|uniref:hypothetical protein n=1 Tax=Coleofasciculus sp. FACHB-1120 TaxID=2692783 RepID=UPI0016833748|nr:hypothetical protein [Coleofasciculus sp. FACHB-1120]MBD2740936.1 hypothetical protein [Coleofasciculus sp. FACHB-1120]
MKISIKITTSLLLLFSVSLQAEAKNLHSRDLFTADLGSVQMNEEQLLARKVPSIRIQPNRLRAALSTFRTRRVKIGSTNFTLGPNDMRHILREHHPRFWNLGNPNKKKKVQTFFRENMTVDSISNAVISVANQNRQKLSRIGFGTAQVNGVVNGVTYVLGVKQGRLHQFYPIK